MTSLRNRLGLKHVLVAVLFVAGTHALASSGCSGESVKGGMGGTSASGTGGTSSPGTAGTSLTGTAGTSSPGTAGTSSSGTAGTSSSGTAGTTGTGGTSATTNTDPATFAYLYANGVEGWTLNNYNDMTRVNLADPTQAANPAPTLAFDSTVGNPDPGSLKVSAHFTNWKQYVDAIINVNPPKVLTGRVLRVRVRLTSGNFTGGAQIHAGTGSTYRFAAGTWTTMTVGSWTELAIDLDAARAADTMFDPSMVVQIGVKFDTGGDGLTTAFGSPIDAVFQIDTFSDGIVGTLPPAVNYTFDADAQGFTLNNFDNTSRKNLAGPNSPTTPMLTWDGAAGNPSPGSLKVAVSYSDFSQYVDAAINLSSVDLTGKVLHAFVRLDIGSFTGGVQLHAGAGPNYVFAASTYTPLTAFDTWVELTLDCAAAQTTNSLFVANDIRQIGVQFDTGDPYEGGTFVATDAIFHVDSVTAQ